MLTQLITTSGFVKRYSQEISKWSLAFEVISCPILAISRKGPRLLELLYHNGLTDQSVLERTCSEYAIPFLKNVRTLSIVDDSVLYGSTIKDTIETVQNNLHLKESDLNIIPLRYSASAVEEIKQSIDKNFSSPIPASDSFVHITQLVNSFKTIGKPYDLEFPILYLEGDFSDMEVIQEKLESISEELGETSLIVNRTPNYHDRFTLLLKAFNTREVGAGAEFSKIRVIVNDKKTRISFVPISPCIISNEDLKSFDEKLSQEFRHLWTEVLNSIKEPLTGIEYNSLIVWANYLKSLSFFAKRLPFFEKYFKIDGLRFDQFDLQLLLGFELPKHVLPSLTKAVKDKKKFVFFEQNHENYSNINEYVIPHDKKEPFFTALEENAERFKVLNSEAEILNFFFHAQHMQLEISSRDPEKLIPVRRLKFGFTLNYLIDSIRQYIPNASITNIHAAFDKLIDLGSIVPKYLNLSKESGKTIWGRVYRVGETGLPTSQKIIAFLNVCKNLSHFYGKNEIPAVVLEKCIVLSLTSSFRFRELNEDGINGLDIKKKFGLYGARSYITTDVSGSSGLYFLSWAKTIGIVKQTGNEDYFINPDIEKTYDTRESGISSTAKDKIEDIAKFCHFIATEASTDYLVLFTTLASQKELWLALSAELQLWLSHPKSGITTCTHKLIEIRNKLEKKNDVALLLTECNKILKDNANFTAQVGNKIEIFDNYRKFVDNTEALIAGRKDSALTRVWRSLKEYLELQAPDLAKSFHKEEVTDILRICHLLTSLYRTLLNKAGFPSSSTIRTIDNYLKLILSQLEALNEKKSLVARVFEDTNIVDRLKDVIIKFDDQNDFVKTFDSILPLIVDITDAINKTYYLYGNPPVINHTIKIYDPPIFIVMWDVRKSTSVGERTDLEKSLILPLKEKLRSTLGSNMLEEMQILDANDGGSFLTKSFSDVLTAFNIINQKAIESGVTIRVGCETNILGELHKIIEKNIIAGRAYEYADRVTRFFKEKRDLPEIWQGEELNEPDGNYLIVSEFVKRFALEKNQWIVAGFNEKILEGTYSPRVKAGTFFPFKLILITSAHSS